MIVTEQQFATLTNAGELKIRLYTAAGTMDFTERQSRQLLTSVKNFKRLVIDFVEPEKAPKEKKKIGFFGWLIRVMAFLFVVGLINMALKRG